MKILPLLFISLDADIIKGTEKDSRSIIPIPFLPGESGKGVSVSLKRQKPCLVLNCLELARNMVKYSMK